MSPGEPLPLETYALALAHLLRHRGEPIVNVLGRLNISADAFASAERHWNGELAQSMARRKGVLAMKFASALAAARQDLGLLDPSTGHAAAREAAVAHHVPSYLRDDRAAAIPRAAPSYAAAPSGIDAPPPAPVAPFSMQTTFAPDNGSGVSAPLPFMQAGSGAPHAPLEPARPAAPRVNTGTALVDDAARSHAATPWEAAARDAALASLPPLPFSVEHYAALVVELARRPPDPLAVLARYGVRSAGEHAHLTATFNAHLGADAGLRGRYESLVIRYSTMPRA